MRLSRADEKLSRPSPWHGPVPAVPVMPRSRTRSARSALIGYANILAAMWVEDVLIAPEGIPNLCSGELQRGTIGATTEGQGRGEGSDGP